MAIINGNLSANVYVEGGSGSGSSGSGSSGSGSGSGSSGTVTTVSTSIVTLTRAEAIANSLYNENDELDYAAAEAYVSNLVEGDYTIVFQKEAMEFSFDTDHYVLTKYRPPYTSSATVLTDIYKVFVPSEYNDGTNGTHSVTEIGAAAFAADAYYEGEFFNRYVEVILPSTITTIGARAFLGQTVRIINLEFVSSIGESAFENSYLTSIEFGESITAIPANCCKNCAYIQSVEFPQNDTFTIGEAAFSLMASNAEVESLCYIFNSSPPSGAALSKFTSPSASTAVSAVVPYEQESAFKLVTEGITTVWQSLFYSDGEWHIETDKTLDGAYLQLNNKVDSESGKGLSSNDYTSAEKTKLNGIATGANAYSLPTASSSTLGGVKVGSNLSISSGVLSATNTTYSAATTSASGLMSAADKSKLNGIATGANNYSLPLATSTVRGGITMNVDTTNAILYLRNDT